LVPLWEAEAFDAISGGWCGMTWPVQWTEPHWKKPRIFEKVEERKAVDKQKRDTYREIDARDGRRCRCCGRKGNPNAVGALGRIHRCHIHDAGTQGAMSAKNLVSLCWLCASLETAKQLFIIGTDANREDLRFEIMDAAVVDIFGERELPPNVRIILKAPRQRYGR
jgi:hypothetical protein